jgi:parallel beta-helix repeat protein
MLDTLAGSFIALRVIADCYIGTDATGRTAAPNGLRGIRLQVTPNYSAYVSIVGNVISGNAHSGIYADAGSDIRITDNRVGVAAGEEMAPLGNGASGIYLGAAQDVVVNGNVVAFNRDAGIGSSLSSNFIDMQRNVLRANGGLGFDFGLDGVTGNDDPNRPKYLPPFPILTNARWDAASGVTRIEGIAPASIYPTDRGTVDVYRSSGTGSADEWLGTVIVEASDQPRPFVFTVGRNLQGQLAVATLTRAGLISRWTSEFSAPVPITP